MARPRPLFTEPWIIPALERNKIIVEKEKFEKFLSVHQLEIVIKRVKCIGSSRSIHWKELNDKIVFQCCVCAKYACYSHKRCSGCEGLLCYNCGLTRGELRCLNRTRSLRPIRLYTENWIFYELSDENLITDKEKLKIFLNENKLEIRVKTVKCTGRDAFLERRKITDKEVFICETCHCYSSYAYGQCIECKQDLCFYCSRDDPKHRKCSQLNSSSVSSSVSKSPEHSRSPSQSRSRSRSTSPPSAAQNH